MKSINTSVVVGAQWGDEGKGKISDFLAQKADVVVRYQGGNNAGHSIKFNGKRYALKHIPSGVFNPKTVNIMGQGMVINPKMLLDEMEELHKQGVTNYQLCISDRAHVILPYHLEMDAELERIKSASGTSIGTTKKGIGPAYEDKYARIGIRFGDFILEEAFKAKLKETLLIKNKVLDGFGLKNHTVDSIFNEYKEYAKKLAPLVRETGSYLEGLILNGKEVVFEGAQGVMLCIENGTYPYVTSSSPTSSSVPLGAGISTQLVNRSIGIVKSYTTRVGAGALPTEIEDEKLNSYIRKTGNEFGVVTGRPRRIGWLDTVLLKHSIRVSGLTEVALTLLDVLDNLETIKIAYAYELNGKEIHYIPGSNDQYESVKPKYIEMPGWKKDTTNVTSFNELPKNAQLYINKIEELLGIPVTIFSVGPDRNQTIYKD